MADEKAPPARGFRIVGTTDNQNIGIVLPRLPDVGTTMSLGGCDFDIIAVSNHTISSYNYIISVVQE